MYNTVPKPLSIFIFFSQINDLNCSVSLELTCQYQGHVSKDSKPWLGQDGTDFVLGLNMVGVVKC